MRNHKFKKLMFIFIFILLLSSCEYFPQVSPKIPDDDLSIITLIGDSTIYINVYDEYEELGATCSEQEDSTCEVLIDSSNVDVTKTSTYTVYYTVVDTSDTILDSITRTVIVQDLIAPEIELNGKDTIYVDISDTYIDLGASCTDNYDASCEVTIDDSEVDMTTVGTYVVTYFAMDTSLNETSLERTVVVEDHSDRRLIIPTDDIIYHLLDEAWTNPSFYVPNEGTYNAITYDQVDPSTLGTYELFYELTDELDNTYYLKYYVHVVSEIPLDKDVVVLDNLYFTYPTIFSQLIIYDTNNDLILDHEEISNVVSLDLSDLGIESIDFIEEYTSLESLDLSDNNLYDLDFMLSLPHLKNLNVDANHLDSNDMIVLTDHTILESLDLSHNFIQDISSLDGLTNLDTLNLSHNFVDDLSTISSLTSLLHLDVSYNPVDDFKPILGFSDLETLNIYQTDITNIKGIMNFESLDVLTLNPNITDYNELRFLRYKFTLNIPDFDADLEYSYLLDYLTAFGVTFNVNSLTTFDEINPNIHLFDTSAIIVLGETLDMNDIGYYIYDADDLYQYTGLESSVLTSELSVGNHIITLNYTDTDGNTSSVEFNISVVDNNYLANVVVFIRFADETTYESPYAFEYYNDLFNGQTTSLKDYYLEVSNQTFEIETIFPSNDILFYTDSHDRAYYEPYDKQRNKIGYTTDYQRNEREYALLSNAIYWLEDSNLIDESVVLDYNNDGEVDAVTFLISGQVGDWGDLIWPHQYAFYASYEAILNGEDAPSINGSYVFTYTFQLIGNSLEDSDYFNLGVFVHEMFHVISATDLYHYYSDDGFSSVGNWDIMDATTSIPSHMLLYMKDYYGNWDQDEFYVTTDGTYTLNVSTSLTDNLIIIDLGYSNEYLYIEYRRQTGDYEVNLPDEGVIIYRVDKDYEGDGNVDGYYNDSNIGIDEVFVFRPLTYDEALYASDNIYYMLDDRDADLAMLQLGSNEQAGPTTNIPLFFSDGREININITLIFEDSNSVEISIDFLD
jgi:M6 family metalloprotease-like protein